MDCKEQERVVQVDDDDAQEATGIAGSKLLVEILDASLADNDGRHPLGFPAGDGWPDDGQGQEELMMKCIHPHQECCEDCGLDDILSDFELEGSPAPPYAVNDDDDDDALSVGYMAEETGVLAAAALGPFAGECMEEWYMDGMVTEWDDGRSYYSFYPSSYAGDGEDCMEQPYGSPLWE